MRARCSATRTLDGVIDARDALYVSNMAVSNTFFAECMLGTDVRRRDCIAANVAPANEPGLGEADDPCPPGLEACGGFRRVVDARDVREISREAVGIDQPVPGQAIPRPTTTASDTVALTSFSGTRVLSADTIYRISGIVEVGVDGAGGGTGELVVEPGVKIVASVDAALVVGRNGRIRGTRDRVPAHRLRLRRTAVRRLLAWRSHSRQCPGERRLLRHQPCDGQELRGMSRGVRSCRGGTLRRLLRRGRQRRPGVRADPQRWCDVRRWPGAPRCGVRDRAPDRCTSRTRRPTEWWCSAEAVDLREIRIQMPGTRGFVWSRGWRGTLQYMAVQAGNSTQVGLEGNSSDVVGAMPMSDPVLRNVTLVSGPDAAAAPQLSGGHSAARRHPWKPAELPPPGAAGAHRVRIGHRWERHLEPRPSRGSGAGQLHHRGVRAAGRPGR